MRSQIHAAWIPPLARRLSLSLPLPDLSHTPSLPYLLLYTFLFFFNVLSRFLRFVARLFTLPFFAFSPPFQFTCPIFFLLPFSIALLRLPCPSSLVLLLCLLVFSRCPSSFAFRHSFGRAPSLSTFPLVTAPFSHFASLSTLSRVMLYCLTPPVRRSLSQPFLLLVRCPPPSPIAMTLLLLAHRPPCLYQPSLARSLSPLAFPPRCACSLGHDRRFGDHGCPVAMEEKKTRRIKKQFVNQLRWFLWSCQRLPTPSFRFLYVVGVLDARKTLYGKVREVPAFQTV